MAQIETLVWEDDARSRLQRVPFFIRPLVKMRVEKVAHQRKLSVISEALLLEIKKKEMPV